MPKLHNQQAIQLFVDFLGLFLNFGKSKGEKLEYHRGTKLDLNEEAQLFFSFYPGFGVTVGANYAENYYPFSFFFNNKMNQVREFF